MTALKLYEFSVVKSNSVINLQNTDVQKRNLTFCQSDLTTSCGYNKVKQPCLLGKLFVLTCTTV